MAFIPSVTIGSLLGHPEAIVFTDESTGSDSNITEKHIYLTKEDGTYLTPTDSTTDYIIWPTASNPFIVYILPKDLALSIEITWDDGNVGFLLINDLDELLINSTDKLLL